MKVDHAIFMAIYLMVLSCSTAVISDGNFEENQTNQKPVELETESEEASIPQPVAGAYLRCEWRLKTSEGKLSSCSIEGESGQVSSVPNHLEWLVIDQYGEVVNGVDFQDNINKSLSEVRLWFTNLQVEDLKDGFIILSDIEDLDPSSAPFKVRIGDIQEQPLLPCSDSLMFDGGCIPIGADLVYRRAGVVFSNFLISGSNRDSSKISIASQDDVLQVSFDWSIEGELSDQTCSDCQTFFVYGYLQVNANDENVKNEKIGCVDAGFRDIGQSSSVTFEVVVPNVSLGTRLLFKAPQVAFVESCDLAILNFASGQDEFGQVIIN
ncbi:hypothetical protein [Pseudobacteriovorax antillogorgiicola]|uniref:Uncharacterized protein n=1 Tax=Pseudobacteriovorax antillogorgiicola TaxID=1513793 RepID=A0A1Y6B639_9BACT|nr:hypothetical protein [Pseudobacteriovorax antillogorgiicola]TCS58839.1 hypothetical protein EDD56_102354 [Pseudobacteriovorax antillogorgiicola]SME94091.1 hypothetical protein SAMN06296036_10289 [Pseudobacteriovorax antillogorgiicola]